MTSPRDASHDSLLASLLLNEHLQDLTEALAAARTRTEVLDAMLTPAIGALGALAGVVLLVDEDSHTLQVAVSKGYVTALPILWQDGPLDNQVPAADVLRTGEALYFEDAGELTAVYPDLEAQTGAVAAVATAVLPMFLDGQPLGTLVLDFKEPHTFTHQERRFLRTLASQCAVALGRADSLQQLKRHLKERIRTILKDTQAHEAFVAFAEAAGSETNLVHLVQQAINVLQIRFPAGTIIYYEQEDGLWKARIWSDDLRPDLIPVVTAGLPSNTPLFAELVQTRAPVFADDWPDRHQQATRSNEYGAAGAYPLIVRGELHWLLSVGLRNTRTWTETDKALVRSVGRSLNLVLERTEAARQVLLRNAELQARTRALEAFADLTRDLALTTDPLLLIRRAQEVVLSMLSDGVAAYLEPEGDRWHNRVQHGTLHSPELQAVVDAGLPFAETRHLMIPWTSGQPYYQSHHDPANSAVPSLVGHVRAIVTLPLRVEGKVTGVLAFVLFDQRAWSSVDKVILETAVQSLELALDRGAKTRRLDEERTALAAFTRFAELVGSETDVQTLVRQAINLLYDTCGVDSVFCERAGDMFRATVWCPKFDQTLLLPLQRGYPLQNSALAQNLQHNTATYIDHWNESPVIIEETKIYRAVAGYPYLASGDLESMLIIGSRITSTWDERTRGIFSAVGRSLDLALDRARHTRTITAQRDLLEIQTRELRASTQELEGFSYSVSHDLRTPVRHMLGFLHLAQKELDGLLTERARRYLSVIEQSGTQMNTLIDALLDLSSAAQRTLRPTTVDLNDIMTHIQATSPYLAMRNIDWEVSDLPSVVGDRESLTQVLTQLTENALKFTRTRDPARIRVWAEDAGEVWKVCVQDNGLGFDPRYQDRLFNLFQRLHSMQEASGTGVGLATVRRLILKHGGQVFAEGQVGQGAIFGFTLPMSGSPRQ